LMKTESYWQSLEINPNFTLQIERDYFAHMDIEILDRFIENLSKLDIPK